MNDKPGPGIPATANLLSNLEGDALYSFVGELDGMERIVVVSHLDQREAAERKNRFGWFCSELLVADAHREAALWNAATSMSQQAHGREPDPFWRILNISGQCDLRADWELMRCSPHARQVLNVYLLEQLAHKERGDA